MYPTKARCLGLKSTFINASNMTEFLRYVVMSVCSSNSSWFIFSSWDSSFKCSILAIAPMPDGAGSETVDNLSMVRLNNEFCFKILGLGKGGIERFLGTLDSWIMVSCTGLTP